ncbi:hypothetical protein [Prosthecobacter sp.]|uniref:hypothetical protein n=1 Tax=Prosthecobacter sp. TaxID=1965333 RepID=UPI00378307A5
MNSAAFNIFERIVMSEADEYQGQRLPRMEVRRASIPTEVLRRRFSGCSDAPRFPVSALLNGKDEGTDLAAFFTLDPLANRVERDVAELLFSHYSRRERNSQGRAVFVFSMPVPVEGGHLLYYGANFGFLTGHDLLCRFEGSFDSPTSLEFLLLGMS